MTGTLAEANLRVGRCGAQEDGVKTQEELCKHEHSHRQTQKRSQEQILQNPQKKPTRQQLGFGLLASRTETIPSKMPVTGGP